jgi:ABC-2 type transport system permease protein
MTVLATGRVTSRHVLTAELLKLHTARSMIAASVTAGLLVVAVGVVAAIGQIVQEGVEFDPLGGALTGVSAASFAVMALGVLAVTSEYATGTVKPSFTAVPRRSRLVLGKAAAVAVTVGVLASVTLLTTFLVAQAITATADLPLSLGAPGVARTLAGAALYLTGIALLAVAFGWLLRSTAGAIAALIGVLLVPSLILLLLPADLGAAVAPYLPGNAGTALLQLEPGGLLSPVPAAAVFFGYAAAALIAAVLAVRSRDV